MKWLGILIIVTLGFSFVYQADEIIWIRNLNEALNLSESQNKDVVIYFGADWCAPCKITESNALSESKFVNFSNDYIMLKIYDDYTAGETDKRNYFKDVKKRFKINSIPMFVILRNGKELDRFEGLFRNAESLIKRIRATN